jgi:glutamate synthase (NADPH/NADH) small chain
MPLPPDAHRAPVLEPAQYEKNFADIGPPFSRDEALAEANRCLYCHDAPCIKACPTHIDIPAFIKKIATGNVKGSARTILEANVLGASCARVCPVEALCEGDCVYNDWGQRPIHIGRLQRHATDYATARGLGLKDLRRATAVAAPGKRVAVVGGGPAGLSCAAELRLMGHHVEVFDAQPKGGGLNTYGIAWYKMTNDVPLDEVEQVRALGVVWHHGVRVGEGGQRSFAELEREFDAIFLGLGMGAGWTLGIPGEGLRGVVDALDFIEDLRTKPLGEVWVGRSVAVIGGGNTAIDAVTQARRLGAEHSYLVYRRGPDEMPAYHYEYELAKGDACEFVWRAAPTRVLDDGEGRVRGLECVQMRLGAPDQSGRRRPEPEPGSEFVIEVDMVIKAVGQSTLDTFAQIAGLRVDKGLPVVDPATFQTTNPRYFSGGDCASGGAEVVNAVADGKVAAQGIHKYLSGAK